MQQPKTTIEGIVLLPTETRHYHRELSAPRIQRQNIRRAHHPNHRQPRVRLGKPTGPSTYVHWQDYLDISDLHKMPKTPESSETRREEHHHESVSEMMNRYRQAAENLNEKINHALNDLKPKFSQSADVEEVESLED